MFGKKITWSPVELDYLKKHKKDPVNQLTIALAKSRNAVPNKIREITKGTKQSSVATKKKGHQTYKIGKRTDCDNLFFRSAWEANIYRWFKHTRLNHLYGGLTKIEYEPQCFDFFEFGHKSGTTNYIPDFRLTFSDGMVLWVEAKGYLKPTDKTKIRRFKKYYPEEFNKLTFISHSPGHKSTAFFISLKVPVLAYYSSLRSEFADIIPHWE